LRDPAFTCIERHYNVAYREVPARELSKEGLLELRRD
jgi:hypothetical protein